MAETSEEKSSGGRGEEPLVYAPQSQKQRWVKYGFNVVLSSLIAIALAVVVTWAAEGHDHRHDTTAGGTQSLRPQSINNLKDLRQKVQIVALYPKLKSESEEQDYYQPVADLLTEYATKSDNISTDMIDPDTEKDEFNKLVADVTNKYGGEVKGYKAILNDLPAESDKIDKFASAEMGKFRDLPFDQAQGQDLQQAVNTAYLTLALSHKQLGDLKTAVESELDQRVPSYKDGVDDVKATYTNISQYLLQFSQVMKQLQGEADLPKAVRDYAPDAGTRADAARKVADAMLARIGQLGALKELDDFKTQLKNESIIVMTDSGYKILSFDQVWKVPDQVRIAYSDSDVQSKLNFAGEEEITAAIETLTSKTKPMIVFVRASGPALAGPPGSGGIFGAVAQRLRDYNFDVEDKSTGEQPPQDQDAPPAPEPTDEQMKSAVWVVFRSPHDTQAGERSPLNEMVAAHERSGGSAMILLFPASDAMDSTLMPLGIKVQTDYLLAHETPPAPERRTDDLVAAAEQNQLVFKLNNYGTHPITTPLQGLDFLQAVSAPVLVAPPGKGPPGVTLTPLLPIPTTPQAPHSWAAADAMSLLSSEHPVLKFHPRPDPESGEFFSDVDNTPATPLFGAAAAEKGGERVVVVGSYVFASTDLVNLPDQDMLEKHGLDVARLPGNGEFFINSIFWLCHMDSMLAISPHALQVSRIQEMTPKKLTLWRLGVLTAGLPAAVIVMGLLVYWRRQD